MNQKDAFKVPNHYFEDLENKILNQTINQNKKDGFITPIDYFNELEEHIMRKVHTQNKVFTFQSWMKYAAIFIVGLGLFLFWKTTTTSTVNNNIKNPIEITQQEDERRNDAEDQIIVGGTEEREDITEEPLISSTSIKASQVSMKTHENIQKPTIKNEHATDVIYESFFDENVDTEYTADLYEEEYYY